MDEENGNLNILMQSNIIYILLHTLKSIKEYIFNFQHIWQINWQDLSWL